MALNPSNSSDLEQLALKGLSERVTVWSFALWLSSVNWTVPVMEWSCVCVSLRRAAGRLADDASPQRQRNGRRRLQHLRRRRRCVYSDVLPARTASGVQRQSTSAVAHAASATAATVPWSSGHAPAVHGQLHSPCVVKSCLQRSSLAAVDAVVESNKMGQKEFRKGPPTIFCWQDMNPILRVITV